MARFGQQTKLLAAQDHVDVLIAKFLEAAELQRDNPACELMITGKSTIDADVVYLIEVWASEEDWEQARTSNKIAAWSLGMQGLVVAPPESVRFDPAGGKGIPSLT